MPEQQEWWRAYTQLLHFADGSTEVNIHEKDIPAILAEHRKMVVREIREELSKRNQNTVNPKIIEAILSLPELKEE